MANSILQNEVAVSYTAISVSATFSANCTPGSWIIVEVTQENGAGTFTINDGVNAGNYATDALASGLGSPPLGAGTNGIYKMQNNSSTALTVTATLGIASTGLFKIYEILGIPLTGELDAANIGSGAGTNESVSINTSQNNSTVFAIGTHYPAGAVVDSGYTAAFSEIGLANSYHFGEHNIDVGSSGSKTITFGLGNEQGWVLAVAAYKTNIDQTTRDGAKKSVNLKQRKKGPLRFKTALRSFEPTILPAPIPVVDKVLPKNPRGPKGVGRGPAKYGKFKSSPRAVETAAVLNITLSAGGTLVFSGTVPLIRERLQTASGTIIFSGTVDLLREKIFSVSGSVIFSGAVALIKEKIFTTTGTIVFSGTTDYSKERIIPASGTIIFSGSVNFIPDRVFTCNGTVVFSGTAANRNYTRNISPTGEVVFSGGAQGGMIFIPAGAGVTSSLLPLVGHGRQ